MRILTTISTFPQTGLGSSFTKDKSLHFPTKYHHFVPSWVLSPSNESWRFLNFFCHCISHGFVLTVFWCRFSLTFEWTWQAFPSCPQSLLSPSTPLPIFFPFMCSKFLTDSLSAICYAPGLNFLSQLASNISNKPVSILLSELSRHTPASILFSCYSSTLMIFPFEWETALI